jgi:hypothetical protein
VNAPYFEDVPVSLRDQSVQVGNGELLWRQLVAVEVAHWLAAKRVAILGGEVYRSGLTEGWGAFVQAWNSHPGWKDGESWRAFVDRARSQAVAVIEADTHATEPPGDRLFFLATCLEADFDRQWHGPYARGETLEVEHRHFGRRDHPTNNSAGS